ncbi:heterokaryon incompatibility protein-domain-containing protein [Trametes polyzona]|nr:heterokaryon incompatibility protein-domain-containing protein [Trametes polyzona]
MRLLNTTSFDLESFPAGKIPPYAILSHVWQTEEQSLQDVQAIHAGRKQRRGRSADAAWNGLGLSAKIRGFCVYARNQGYKWVWIDTCCIDKTSSAELSEALNSIYTWYEKAEMCFAFLQDVRGEEDPHLRPSSFRNSLWFKRGWTLQELLAPHTVIFLSKHWQPLGTNHALAGVIEEITGIDRDVLTHRRPLRDVSVARRMSWASKRVTEKIEDRAYSLMGIFDVYMPVVYGEGARAFTRLQEEILKQIPDQSIFVWGPWIHEDHDMAVERTHKRPLPPQTYKESLAVPHHLRLQGLLAQSPDDFVNSHGIRPIPFSELTQALGIAVPVPVYHPTSGGLRIGMPIILSDSQHNLSEPDPGSASLSFAALSCKNEEGDLIVLYLRRDLNSEDRYLVGFPTRGRYLRAASWKFRTCDVEIVNVYVAHQDRPPSAFPSLPAPLPLNVVSSERLSLFFFFPPWILARMKDFGFSPVRSTLLGTRWDAQGLDTGDGLSVEVSCSNEDLRLTAPATKPRLAGSQLFSTTFPGGSASTWLRISFWIGCDCSPRHVLESVWIDVRIGTDLSDRMRLPPERSAHAEGKSCDRSHLSSSGIPKFTFSSERYAGRCEVVPWCAYPLRPGAPASCEYLMDLSLELSGRHLGTPGPSPASALRPFSPAARPSSALVRKSPSLEATSSPSDPPHRQEGVRRPHHVSFSDQLQVHGLPPAIPSPQRSATVPPPSRPDHRTALPPREPIPRPPFVPLYFTPYNSKVTVPFHYELLSSLPTQPPAIISSPVIPPRILSPTPSDTSRSPSPVQEESHPVESDSRESQVITAEAARPSEDPIQEPVPQPINPSSPSESMSHTRPLIVEETRPHEGPIVEDITDESTIVTGLRQACISSTSVRYNLRHITPHPWILLLLVLYHIWSLPHAT